MRYQLLGPLRLADGKAVSALSARKIEIVLAVLLIRVDQVVSLDQLMGEVWGEHPPRRATAGIHVYISQLRKFLHRPGGPENPVVTRSPGYMLRSGSDEIDFRVFLREMNAGRTQLGRGRPDVAAEHLERAMGLWRGVVLGDLRAGPVIDGFTTWLSEARLECLELLMEAKLELGRHRELVGHLYSLTAEHPLRESFHRQLMIALYRSERQADALRAYQSLWKVLDEEVGLEPCAALQSLQKAILLGDPRLDPSFAAGGQRVLALR